MADNIVDENYVAALERELDEHKQAGRDDRAKEVNAELARARKGTAPARDLSDELGPLGAKNEDHGTGEGRAHEAGMVIDENHPDAERVLAEKRRLATQGNLAKGGTPEHVANVINVGTDATGEPSLGAEQKKAAAAADKPETATKAKNTETA